MSERRLIVLCLVDEHAQVVRFLASEKAPKALAGAIVQSALMMPRVNEDTLVAAVWHHRDEPDSVLEVKSCAPVEASKYWVPDRETGGRVHSGSFLAELAKRISPCTIKHKEDVVRIAYA